MIAICITTRNRKDVFKTVVKHIKKYTDTKYTLIVVDDASDEEYAAGDVVYRFNERVGIPRAKNKCLKIAMGLDVDDIFLFDDDCYPISHGWENKYIDSGENHLCYTFLPHKSQRGKFKIHNLGNGCMMYVKRICVERIGGFDTFFGIGKYEHVDFSRRINNSGLTRYRFMDLVGSDKLLYSLDQRKEIGRSFTKEEINKQLKSGVRYFNRERKSKKYISYED